MKNKHNTRRERETGGGQAQAVIIPDLFEGYTEAVHPVTNVPALVKIKPDGGDIWIFTNPALERRHQARLKKESG